MSTKISRAPKRGGAALRLILAAATLFPANSVFAESGGDSNIDTRNYLESEDYIFTAERIPTNRWDTPANVHVITAQEIEENHYQTLEEALNHVNGVVVFMQGIFSSAAVLNGNDRVLLLIDGHRANNSQTETSAHRKSDLTVIPSMKMIERIEIVKGGYSALYGTDAVGGVINIITKKGTRDETTVDINYGSWSRRNFEITNQGVTGNLSWFFTGNLAKSSAYDYKGSGRDVVSKYSDYDDNGLSIRLDNRFTDSDSITFSATHKTHKWADDINNLYNNFVLSYNFKEGTNTPSWLRYFNHYKTREVQDPGNVRIQGVEYQNGWELGKHKIIAGVEWHKNEASSPEYGYENKDVKNHAFYIQDTVKLTDKWNVIPGTRYDHSNEYGNNWSPKLSANYRADEKTKIYASWGRVYRVPTIAEIYEVDRLDHFYGNDYFLRTGGRGKLHSEKGHTETIGVEHNFTENIGAALNLYQSNVNDAIYWQRILTGFYNSEGKIVDYGITHTPRNNDRSKNRGVELTFWQKIDDHFAYNLGYSYTKQDNLIESNHFAQPHGYRVGVHYQNRNLRVNLLSFMASGRDQAEADFFGYPTGKYAVFDLNAIYDINEYAAVYLKATNFTNQDYSPYPKTESGNEYHVPGRFFMAGATFRF